MLSSPKIIGMLDETNFVSLAVTSNPRCHRLPLRTVSSEAGRDAARQPVAKQQQVQFINTSGQAPPGIWHLPLQACGQASYAEFDMKGRS